MGLKHLCSRWKVTVSPPTSSAAACSTSEVNRAPVTAFTWEESTYQSPPEPSSLSISHLVPSYNRSHVCSKAQCEGVDLPDFPMYLVLCLALWNPLMAFSVPSMVIVTISSTWHRPSTITKVAFPPSFQPDSLLPWLPLCCQWYFHWWHSESTTHLQHCFMACLLPSGLCHGSSYDSPCMSFLHFTIILGEPVPVLVASGSEPRSGCTSALW